MSPTAVVFEILVELFDMVIQSSTYAVPTISTVGDDLQNVKEVSASPTATSVLLPANALPTTGPTVVNAKNALLPTPKKPLPLPF